MYVPAGEFQMGATEAQYQAGVEACVNPGGGKSMCQDLIGHEKPIHTVYLDAFWIDQSDVTNVMYAKCVDAGGCQPPSKISSVSRTSYYNNNEYANYPVVYVDWN